MKGLVWLRRDLRLQDNHALYQALKECSEVVLCFIFDSKILKKLPSHDRRFTFIHESLEEIEQKLQKIDSSLIIKFGDPLSEIAQICEEFSIDCVFSNKDYEPYAKKRDIAVKKSLTQKNVEFKQFKDHVFFESNEVLKGDGTIYKVFTPYKRKWLETFSGQVPLYKTTQKKIATWKNHESLFIKDWFQICGFERQDNVIKGGAKEAKKKLKRFLPFIDNYDQARNFPDLDQTSSLSPYIRHGNISIRELIHVSYHKGTSGSDIWLSELVWREFYQTLLDTNPHVVTMCFKEKYNQVPWENDSHLLKAWKDGKTGFPIVDAAMRCLNETGMMHNRLRMIVASFLCKTLLIDYRKGEAYFALKLMDFDLAANNGGWQWSSSTGCDAQPYFRIFNPYTQSEKFDKEANFIKKWVPELKNTEAKLIHHPYKYTAMEKKMDKVSYPDPIVDYKTMRERALAMYKSIS